MQSESEAMLGSWSWKDTGSELRSVHLAAKMLMRPESEATFGFWSCKYAHEPESAKHRYLNFQKCPNM